jgi:hypothetical protein
MCSKHDLRKVNNFMSCYSICTLSLMNTSSKHESRQPEHFIYLNMVTQHEFCQLKNIVYWCSTCSLFVLNMGPNMTCAKLRNKYNGALPTSYLCWTGSRKMTHAKWLNSWIDARHAACLYWIWAPNMTCAKWKNSCFGVRHTDYCATYLSQWINSSTCSISVL